MLHTKDLITWLVAAQRIREQSWQPHKTRYDCSLFRALTETRPQKATNVEFEIAYTLICSCWNEIQDWHHMFNKE